MTGYILLVGEGSLNNGHLIVIYRSDVQWAADTKNCPAGPYFPVEHLTGLARGTSVTFDEAEGSTDECRLATNVRTL